MDFTEAGREVARVAEKLTALDFVAIFEPHPAWVGGLTLGFIAGACALPLIQKTHKIMKNRRLRNQPTRKIFDGIETRALSERKPAP